MTNSVNYQQILTQQLQIPIVLLTSYKTIGLDEKDVMLILQLHRFHLGRNSFPTPNQLASCLTVTEQECADMLRKLIQKNVLAIEQSENEQKQLSEAYSLNPLWNKLFSNRNVKEKDESGTIFILFEQEFGRPLSPFEIEMVNIWLDEEKISPSLIKAALRESVLMGKLNFKYIDRILREWKKKGIHTVEQARDASRSFRNKQTPTKDEAKKRDTSFYYNWLEGEE